MSQFLTTGQLARGLRQLGIYPPASEVVVRGWCEAGELTYWRNPVGQGRYLPKVSATRQFLIDKFGTTPEQLDVLSKRLGVNLSAAK